MSRLLNPTATGPRKAILQHVLLWLTIYAGYSYMLSFEMSFPHYLLINLVNVPLFMTAYYLLKHVQLPQLYHRGQIGLFILSLLASAGLLFAIYLAVWVMGLGNALGYRGRIPFLIPGRILVLMIRFYSPGLVVLAWESHRERRKEHLHLQQLEKDKVAGELKLLKAQINPQFLFNTLNSLHAQVVNESPRAPEMIMSLSGILDYVLYKSQYERVPLREELETIQNYIALEQLRRKETIQVEFQTEGNTVLPISPLSLLPLIESAFRQVSGEGIDQFKISIHIHEQGNNLYCNVTNTKSKCQERSNERDKKETGLAKIKRQLNLIYPNQHELKVHNQDHRFQLSLTLKNLS